MASWIGSALQTLAQRRRQWRRARNLRAGQGARTSARSQQPWLRWSVALGVAGALAGGAIIAGHARQLGATGQALQGDAAAVAVEALQSAAPGAHFEVSSRPGVRVSEHGAARILVASGMQASDPLRIDLCTQLQADGRLAPLRVGLQFEDVARLLASGKSLQLRNVALASAALKTMPQLVIGGPASADFARALSVSVTPRAGGERGRWLGDSGAAGLRRDGWLIWGDAALRVHRRSLSSCARAGELVLQLYQPGAAQRALVMAFPANANAVSAWLAPGSYSVPENARASLEDQALFNDLQTYGLVRLNAGGLAELAPRDLAAWQAAPDGARTGTLASWASVTDDPERARLFKRLYRMADGDYVREQLRIFNNERRLLAWRLRPAQAGLTWQASVGEAPVAAVADLPPAASRLFAELPQGWGNWARVALWPGAAPGASARLRLAWPAQQAVPAQIDVMLVGQLQSISGARLVRPAVDACSGRACPNASAARILSLAPLPGARSIELDVLPLETGALSGDQQYRHLRVAGGRLAWRALASNSSTARRADAAPVILQDRHGAVLWSGGAPSAPAMAAGLGTMLGLRAEQSNSVAGMLARLPSPSGEAHTARMTLDLALQQASQNALDCIGMRRGRWDGAHCSGASAVPHGRQAGMVVIDTASGDVLAAAGAGTAAVDGANWAEVRDFDRANPDRSALRLAATQHDGGALRSPGSTFKIVSALGLELAARRDPQIDALLAGMPLASLNRMAATRGFAFQTDAASYPFGTRLAHITNYKDQHLDRRAVDGRLGLAQALTYSLNTWFAWSGELSDASLFGKAEGGAPDLQALDAGALDSVRPIAAMARRVGFGRELHLDGALLPEDFHWSAWDALQASVARIDPIHSRHELRQMAIGLRMQATPLHMAMVAGAVGEGRAVVPRLLLELDGRAAQAPAGEQLGVRLDRVRAGMKGVVERGTASGAFRAPALAAVRRGLFGKTGTAPALVTGPDGVQRELATVWFTGYLEPGSLPGQKGRLAIAAFVSHSDGSGGDHAAPVVAAVLAALAAQNGEQKGK
ncbi:penicillin-binding transpeptidase domain-containing protein [Massilia sp. CF038]|uniref:penicillin-binding transpeptidase domain-containing protein n=1 Tax=Massilia sp. CF038 TaxID=1881045 RepID=UPI000920B543|nr:penicillin-binding transpeptidase domain-containing protein [Massilia sp. CF038]SHG99167.1 Penicillin binding protein transpeptidase domain-containing protein [Massilia sp. CF038]